MEMVQGFCLGALDGTYIPVRVTQSHKGRYRNRKGQISVNVLVVCDQYMNFTYILTGWEGSAANARVLRDAITRNNGLRVPIGVMEGQGSCKDNITASRRRVWTLKEEEALVQALKDIVQQGWKSDNGFRTGYLFVLEKAMLKVFPNLDLRGEPHINSKVHVWKKNYGSLQGMFGHSGFSWNEATMMTTVEDKFWQEYIKKDTNARTLRHKSFPFFHSWGEIFGKDRATWENAEDFNSADNDQLDVNVDKANELVEEDKNDEDDVVSVCKPSGSTSSKIIKSKKRKVVDTKSDKMVELMGSFCNQTNDRLADISKRIGYEFDMSQKRTAVFEALGALGVLDVCQQIAVAQRLCNNNKDLDLFFSLPEFAKVEMVHMLISRQI